jgi:uncharacterized protein (DUF1501 family)
MSKRLTRRTFLTQAGVLAVGLSGSSTLLAQAARAANGKRETAVVFVLLRGGVDGLSICAPYGDAEYYKARPGIALPKPRSGGRALIDLDGYFGLHPAFASLEAVWREGTLAVLHAVGSYAMSRSHFDAQEFLETGTPGVRGTTTGWMDRCVGAIPGSAITEGIAFAPLEPRAFLGQEPVLVTENLANFELTAPGWRNEAERVLRQMYGQNNGKIAEIGRQAFSTLDVLRASPALRSLPANGARYPVSPFGSAMKQAAQILKARLGTRCVFVGHEAAFDTHSNQIASNEHDFPNVADSLAAFHRDLGKQMDDVVVVVASEFGRTVEEDGSKGTDHGTGGTMLLMGGPVRGGRVAGKWPGLAKADRHEERDLAVTTDFRDVFVEILRKHLRVENPGALFPNHKAGDAGVLR